jgi:hypothetical protein
MKKKERMISKHESKARQAKLVIPKDEVGEIFEDDSDDQEEDGEEDDDE